jgi:hypothetical protein
MAKASLLNTTVTSTVTSPSDVRINIKAQGPLALSKALKTSQQLYAASRIDSKYKPILTSLAGRLNSQIELAIVNELGGGQIKAGSGGFYPDYFLTIDGEVELREQKLVSTKETSTGVERKSRVGLAGGSGITLRTGRQELLTGFDLSSGEPVAQTKNVFTTTFVRNLRDNVNNPAELLKIINGKGAAARAIKKSLMTKANAIDIPVQFQGALQNRTIKFSWSEIQKSINAGKMKIQVKVKDEDTVGLNLYFTGSTITKALNDMNKVVIKELNGSLGTTILKALAEMSILPSGITQKEIEKFLKGMGFDYALAYIVGSAIISRGTVKIKKPKAKTSKPVKTQGFLSGVQWTALVQNQLRRTMRKGGTPKQPNLTERSGRFRGSVRVIPNYRANLVSFYYLPLYSHLQDYGYEPEQQIIRSIREVAQKTYARQFNIQRM